MRHHMRRASQSIVSIRPARNMDRFVGRVALVSGVSSGIGAVIAELLVRAGVVVVGVARRQQRLTELSAKLANEKGKIHTQVADFSRPEDVRRVFQWIDDNLGGVSILVNNAAVGKFQSVVDLSVSEIQELVQLNLSSVMLACREAIQSMKKHTIKDGHIININSIGGHVILNYNEMGLTLSVYGATKHGITAFTKGLRYDIQMIEGFKTRVTSISPGGVKTEMVPESYRNLIKDDEMLNAKDVADAVLYALSCPIGVEITELSIHATMEKTKN